MFKVDQSGQRSSLPIKPPQRRQYFHHADAADTSHRRKQHNTLIDSQSLPISIIEINKDKKKIDVWEILHHSLKRLLEKKKNGVPSVVSQ